MRLSDVDVRKALNKGLIVIEPFVEANLSNATLDVRLDRILIKQLPKNSNSYVDFEVDPETGAIKTKYIDVINEEIDLKLKPYLMMPGEFLLGNLYEKAGTRHRQLDCHFEGKSTLARNGLLSHVTAGYVECGNVLRITTEIKNLGNLPIMLHYKMHIGQLHFEKLTSPCSRFYTGRYNGNERVQIAL